VLLEFFQNRERPSEGTNQIMKQKTGLLLLQEAGGGLEGAIAKAYAREGAKVVLTAARQKAEIEEVASRINGAAFVADVSKNDEVRLLVDLVLSRFGKIDILVNNAACGMRFVNESFMTEPKPFWEADVDAWRMVIDTNITEPHNLSEMI
jgi:NAD(P)-dependent dehydrogenase (short-subunit alcohol dehydrogenase family)